MDRYGSLIVISGPSGVGKSTLVKQAFAENPQLHFSVSCTTRKPRTGEENGKSYYFLSDEEFEQHSKNGDFIEEAHVFDKRYGTLKSEVLKYIEVGEDVLLDIDVQGMAQINSVMRSNEILAKTVASVFIVPPDLATLEARLRNRQTDSEEQLALRIAAAERELAQIFLYDYVVVNDNLACAVADFIAVLKSLRARRSLIKYPDALWKTKK